MEDIIWKTSVMIPICAKREVELILHNRIDGRDNRLNHIVQEMGNATDDEHGIHRTLYHRRISLDFTAY